VTAAALVIIGVLALCELGYTQEVEPEEPGIVLPPMLLEVEDLQIDTVQAVLPDEGQLESPDITIPLPEAETLFIPGESFDIPFPDQIASAEAGYRAPERPPRSVFSEGRIGVGTMNQVTGDISLYKLGPEPRFTLRFYHQKRDGYGFREAGSGYYHIDDSLTGSFSHEAGRVDLGFAGEISEQTEGFQGIGDFESLTHRYLGTDGTVGYAFTDSLGLDGAIELQYVDQVLSSSEPLDGSEFSVRAGVGGRFAARRFTAGLAADYRFLTLTDLAGSSDLGHSVGARLTLSALLPWDLNVGGEVGVAWDAASGFKVPFQIVVDGAAGSVFTFTTAGGYRWARQSYGEIWKSMAFAAQAGPLVPVNGWFWEAEALIRVVGGLSLSLDSDLGFLAGVPSPAAEPDVTTGLFALSSTDMTRLRTGVSVNWSIGKGFAASLGWEGDLLDRLNFAVPHLVSLGVAFDDPRARGGGSIDARMEIGGTSLVPFLDVGGYYKIAEGISLDLEAIDLLSPILEDGRQMYGAYVGPGLRVAVSTRISL
jgi:hypothetical protein